MACLRKDNNSLPADGPGLRETPIFCTFPLSAQEVKGSVSRGVRVLLDGMGPYLSPREDSSTRSMESTNRRGANNSKRRSLVNPGLAACGGREGFPMAWVWSGLAWPGWFHWELICDHSDSGTLSRHLLCTHHDMHPSRRFVSPQKFPGERSFPLGASVWLSLGLIRVWTRALELGSPRVLCVGSFGMTPVPRLLGYRFDGAC